MNCMDKFLKKPRSQRVSATTEDEGEPQSSQTVASTLTASMTDISTLLAQLLEQQKLLAEQIAAIQQSF